MRCHGGDTDHLVKTLDVTSLQRLPAGFDRVLREPVKPA
jgi:hypothetical protein